MEVPADLKYTREHAWVRVEGGEIVFGITDYAQKELGDVVFVELPGVGTTVTQGKVYGVVESVKAISDLPAPLAGTVTRVNAELARTPELVNRDPYGRGWTIAIRPEASAQLDGLLGAADYEAFLAEIAK